jgi:molybdate transport system substrate-binding protein
MATKGVLVSLASQYQKVSGQAVVAEAVGGVDVARRVRAGEAVDVVVLADATIDALVAEGQLLAGSCVDLVTSAVVVGVRAGAPRPDVGSIAKLREVVLAAEGVGYSTGPSGVHLEKLFAQWGILDAIRPHLVVAPPGVPVGDFIAQGRVAIGFQQRSELMHIAGVDIVGALPPEVQLVTTFSAGVSATCRQREQVDGFLRFATSGEVDAAKRANGMEPV